MPVLTGASLRYTCDSALKHHAYAMASTCVRDCRGALIMPGALDVPDDWLFDLGNTLPASTTSAASEVFDIRLIPQGSVLSIVTIECEGHWLSAMFKG